MLMPTPLFPGRGCHRRSADLLRRGDFEDLREVPDEYTPDELRDAHNEVVRRLVPRAVLRALAAAAVLVPVLLCAEVKVETSRLGSLSNKSNVVTSVTFDGVESMSTNSVRGVVDSSFIGGTQEVNRVTSSFGSVSNAAFRVDGAARPLPKYLHALDFDSSYPDAAAEYYRQRLDHGGCSAMRDGGFLYRNFDFPFDNRAEFVVRMSHSDHDTCDGEVRFASVGVAQVGTNLTEDIVTSGKWSKWYKSLPGATVDGINENGVCAEINMVDGVPQWNNPTGDIHPLAAVRWALDNGTSAGLVASNLALRVKFPAGWTQSFHYMIADEKETWIVENGSCKPVSGKAIMTNFPILPAVSTGTGFERYEALRFGYAVTNVWFTNAYRPLANPWISDIGQDYQTVWDEWAKKPREEHRGESFGDVTWWQTVHTSVYDLTNRVLRIAVQETDDWYVFKVPASGTDEGAVREIAESVVAPVRAAAAQALDDADAANANALVAQGAADAAKALAQAAQDTANQAALDAETAQAAAEAAQELAQAANDNADAAMSMVDEAIDTAYAAYEHADDVAAVAENAQTAAEAAQAAADAAQETADSKIDSEEATAIAVSEVEQGIDNYDSNVVYPALEQKADRNGSSIEDFEAKDINSSGTLSVGEVLCGGEVHADGNISSVQSIAAEGDVYAGGYGGVSLMSVANMLDAKAERSMISADDATFSAAVLAVGLDIDAETLQWLKDIGAIAGTTTGKVGIGTLLAALLSALMWLKRNKADKSELPYMTDLGNGRYEYTGALADAETRTYPREVS